MDQILHMSQLKQNDNIVDGYTIHPNSHTDKQTAPS